MTLKCLATGSKANCYVLKRDNGEMLILDAGLPIYEIKKGIGFDVENLRGAVISHGHGDHVLSAEKLKQLTPVWQPYLSKHKRQHTHLGDFDIQCFDLPHNGVENRGFIIRVDGQTICYMTDLEYCPYDLSGQGISTLIVECNYVDELVDEQAGNYRHKVLGHCSLNTTIGIVKSLQKSLRHVLLVHMSKGATMDKNIVMRRIEAEIPSFINVEFGIEGRTYKISEIPF